MRKYSENFERDYKFYFDNKGIFVFCGTLIPKFEAIADKNGKTAKECFYLIDSTGKNHPCCEPVLLNQLLTCKASVNFHIKMWAEGRADGTLSFSEFCGSGETLDWEVKITKKKWLWWLPEAVKKWLGISDKKEAIPIYKKSIAVEYGFPEWVIKAVEIQKLKLYETDENKPDWFKREAQKQKKRYSNKLFTFSTSS